MGTGRQRPGIAVVYNASDGLVKGEPRDLLAEQGVIHCAEAVSNALCAAGYRVAQVPVHADVELALARLGVQLDVAQSSRAVLGPGAAGGWIHQRCH